MDPNTLNQPVPDPVPEKNMGPVSPAVPEVPQTPASNTPLDRPGITIIPATETPTDPQSVPSGDVRSVVVPPDNGIPGKKSKLNGVIAGIIILLLLLVLGGGAVGAYLVAYEKVKLTKYPDIQKKISAAVISLPFMPKTPKYLLARSGYVHQSVTRESYDISMAFDSKDIASALGLSGMDLSAKGNIDYTDTKNVKFTLDASVTKDFNIELLKGDKILYFKINKVPQILLTALSLKSGDLDPLLNQWIAYDTSHLDTEARKSIEDKEVDPLSEQYLDEEFQKYLDEEVLSKMKISDSTVDGFPTYKINLTADAKMIDHLGKKIEEANKRQSGAALNVLGATSEKLSDTVKSLTWDIDIDKKDYYMRKLSVTSDLEIDNLSDSSLYLGNSSTLPKNSKAKIGFVAKFGNFGKEFSVKTPEKSMTTEEFLNKASEVMQKAYSSMLGGEMSAISSSRDARRQSDMQTLRSALELFKADNNKYPATLTVLKGKYISAVPTDPLGYPYFYQPSKDFKSYDLCTSLEAPRSAVGSCPNSAYNTGFKNP